MMTEISKHNIMMKSKCFWLKSSQELKAQMKNIEESGKEELADAG